MNPRYLWTELRRAAGNRRTLLLSVITPTLMLVILGHSRTGVSFEKGGGGAYIMVSMGLFGAMAAALNGCGSIAVERGLGWSRQLRLTPLTPSMYVLSKVLVSMVMVLPPLLMTYVLAAATLDVRLSATVWVELLLGSWVSAVPFAALGVVIGYLANPASAQQISGLVYMLLAAVGGLLVPVSQMPDPIRLVTLWTPTYCAGRALSGLLSGDSLGLRPMGVLLAWSVVLGAVALRQFRIGTARA